MLINGLRASARMLCPSLNVSSLHCTTTPEGRASSNFKVHGAPHRALGGDRGPGLKEEGVASLGDSMGGGRLDDAAAWSMVSAPMPATCTAEMSMPWYQLQVNITFSSGMWTSRLLPSRHRCIRKPVRFKASYLCFPA